MQKTILLSTVLFLTLTLSLLWAIPHPHHHPPKKPSLYDFTVHDIEGNKVKLEKYKGKTLLIVNVASYCGFTPQYKGLQALHEKYHKQGLVVMGFPANNFGRQEPGSNKQIQKFCTSRYHVTFPMFAKISVKGKDQHPLYQFLTTKKSNPKFAGEITWNFNKFLVNPKGEVVARFSSRQRPQGKEMLKALEKNLPKERKNKEKEQEKEKK